MKIDLGRILRNRVKFPAYKSEPKTKKRRWGIFPGFEVTQLFFIEDKDNFRFKVSLFSNDKDEIGRMKLDVIAAAAEGIPHGAWEFWLHAANNKTEKIPGTYRCEINFVFKVRSPIKTEEEA